MKTKILYCMLALFAVAHVFAKETTGPKPAPVITAGSVTGIISACAGSASVSPNIQQFTVSGSGLTANITATAPANFQVSLSAGSGYAASVTLTQAGGTVSNTFVYVRSAASAAVGNISGNVALSSTGATSVNAAVTGAIHALPTVGAVTNQTLINGAATTAINFTGTGQQSWVNNTPGIGLPASGIGNIAPFTAVNTGVSAVTATITVTPNSKTSLYAYVGNALDGTVSVINTATQAVVATIPVGLSPAAIMGSPDASRVYVANFDGNSVSVINTATNTVVATVPVGTAPRGIVVSPDGGKVYVINGNTANVSVISTATNTVTATIPITANPNGIAISPDGSKLYVANQFGNSVSEINTTTNTVTTTFSANSGPYAIAISPDGSKLYVTNPNLNSISVISLILNNITNTIPVGTGAISISASPDGNSVYVANSTSNNVSVINTATNAVVATVPVGTGPRGISVSPDGSQVYVPNFGTSTVSNNTVSIISTATNTVTKTVTVGNDPATSGNFITAGPGCSGTPTTFTITVNPSAAGAVIVASGASGNILSCAGTPSASPSIQQFTVSGAKLTANITATAPAGFQVSLTAGSGYTSSLTLTQTAGTVNSTTIYVRSSASAIGHIIGNIALTSAGTTSQNVAVAATATPLPSVNPVSNQTVTKGAATTAVTFAGNASSFTWTNNTPSIGLAASGTGNIASFTAANPGASPLTATITVTPVPVPNLAYIANATANTVSVINTTTGTTVATIPVGTYPNAVSLSPDGSRVYVANSTSNNVSVINTATNTVVATITVGTGPDGVCFSPDGSKVYVANAFFGAANGTVSVINPVTNTVTATINVGQVPEGLIVSPDGSKLYVANAFSSNLSVVNTTTNAVTATIPSAPGTFIVNASSMVLSPDGSVLYVSGSVNSILAVVNTLTNTVVTTLPVAQYPRSVAISPDGSKVYIVSNGTNSVQVLSTATNTITGTIPVGASPWSANVSADGSTLYVTNFNDNTISVINTATNVVTGTINTGVGPTSLGNFLTAGTTCAGVPITFTITVNPTALPPTITATGTLAALTSVQGVASSSTSFAVSGTNMTAGILVTPPVGFEVSKDNTTFSATVTVGAAGTIASTTVYVRLAAADALGTYSGNIVLSSAGSANVNEATVSSTVTSVALQNQTITFSAITAKIYGAADFAPGATASSGLAVTYASSNTAVATIVAGKIHIVGAGTTNITASQAGNATFNPAADVVQVLTVNKASQTITFAALTAVTYGVADINANATANSGLAVALSSDNTAVATIINGDIHVVGGGTANITASQAGDGNYNAAVDVVHVLTVNKAAQTITFNALSAVSFGAADINPSATSNSGLAVTYNSSNTAVATIVNSQLHIVGVGSTVITASQAGDADYNAAANVTRTLTVSVANQTITFASIGTRNLGNADFDPGATASSGLAIAYASSNTAVATIVSGKIHIVGTGTSTITASQTGNANYSAATNVQQVLTVVKEPQTITFAALPTKTIGDDDFAPRASASSGLPVTYTSSNLTVATIVNGKVHMAAIGSADITASQDGDATFAAATDATRTLTVADIIHAVVVSHPVVTPNGDAINQVLKFDGITDFPNNKVVLVNANGVKIYEQAGYDNASKAFDGHSSINGALQQQGTYFYMVEYTENGATRRLKGYFVIKY